jgi:transcriptional regulator with XRE-family HTH domain
VNGDNRVNDDPTARRRLLGRLLRSARDNAGLTQTTVAKQLDCGQAKINKIEKTLVAICLDDLDKLIELYGVPGTEAAELRRMVELDQQKGPTRTKYAANSAFTDLTESELDAVEILSWHSERFPGPLQSEPYLLEQHAHLIANGADVLKYMLLRADRVRVFTVDNPPAYRAILSEASFRRFPERHATTLLVDQATYLLELIDSCEQVDLRILPFGADVPYVETDFEILRFADDDRPDFAYIEFPSGSKKFTKAADLKEFQDHWTLLSAAALTRGQTRDFLAEHTNGYIPPPPWRVP